MTDFPLLLSPRPFTEYAPAEYAAYVRSLHIAPTPRKIPVKRIPKVCFKRTKTGRLSVTTARKPVKYITEGEFKDACAAQQTAANDLFILIKARGIVLVANFEEGEELCGHVKEIPW